MESQLRDQWDAMMEAGKRDDSSLKARLMIQTAKVLMEEAASLGMPPAQPDQAEKRLLAQWSQAAQVIVGHLRPTVEALGQSLESFKTDTTNLLAHVTQSSERLLSIRSEYEKTIDEHQELERQADELRKAEAGLEPLLARYQDLKALDERVKAALSKLADDQAALTALWPALREACKHLQAQRELLTAQFDTSGSIVESLEYENKLFGESPGPALELAILAVTDARDALAHLAKQLNAARQEQQEQLSERMARSLDR